MGKKKKFRLKKIKFHPITSYLLLIVVTIILSAILSSLKFQTTYSTISATDLSTIQNTVKVENLFNYDGIKYMISNASKNFISFAPLSMFLLIAIGIAISSASGFLDLLFKKIFAKIDNKTITFFIIFIATISTIINDIFNRFPELNVIKDSETLYNIIINNKDFSNIDNLITYCPECHFTKIHKFVCGH